MNFNCYLLQRVAGFAAVFLLVFFSLDVIAQEHEPVSADIIRFSENEHLSAENAAQILSDRLKLSSSEELRSVYIEKPGDGLQVQRFNQYYKGIPVAHGTYTLTSKNGIASYAFGKYFPVKSGIDVAPQMDESSALAKAIGAIHAEKYEWEEAGATTPKATLALIEDFTNGDGDGVLHLAYVFDIYALQPVSRNTVYVDAQNGKILFMDAILKHINATGASLYSDTVAFVAGRINSTKYYLNDSTRGSGIFTYNLNHGMNVNTFLQDSSATNFFSKEPAVDAHWGAEKVYDYWKSAHNRLSWNGTDGVLRSFVHYGTGYNNAMWNGSAMVYGDGSGSISGGLDPLTSLDICGHEIGHGVCQTTAALVYSKESGAMNEGFSDIWGSVIEHYGDPHEVDAMPKNTWLIGEEVGNALRSMSDPKQYGQPDCYQGAYWVCTTPTCSAGTDNWGVHTNSGVLNHWFYLLCLGGKGTNDLNNPFQVRGLGMDTAAKIVYATELALNNTATYANCRAASIAAATTIYGACSKAVEAVTRAWYAVGVGSNYVPCTPQVSFDGPASSYTEDANANQCHTRHIISVPVVLNGPALAGGNAIITATVIGGTAVAGVDYDLTKAIDSFTTGGPSTRTIDLTVYDNGTIGSNKYVDLVYTLATGSSNATKSQVMDTTRVTIANDDRLPDAGGPESHQVLTNGIIGDASSPFPGKNFAAHIQYIYRADELKAAGVRPGVPITSINYFVTTKGSGVQSFLGYTLGLINTPQLSLAGGFISSGFTTVYSGNYTTTSGSNPIPFSTPFVWNGTDNIAVEICFSDTSNVAGNDRVQAQPGSYTLAAYATSNLVTSGCNLPFNVNNLVGSRPVMLFTQDVPPTPIETAAQATRTWNMNTLQQIYFYSAGAKKLIAAIVSPSDTLGCVTTTVTGSGNGFTPTAFGGGHRSVKEFFVTASNQAPVTYDGIFYLNTTELAGKDPANLNIVQTTSANDNGITSGNTKIITPGTIITGADYYGFRGNFSGFNRFFFLEGNLLAVNGPAGITSALWTGLNPFTESPILFWNLSAPEQVTIRLYDVTGKLLYEKQQTLNAGQHQVSIKANADLVPGTYVLQVIRPSAVFTRQLVKQ